MLSTSSPVCSVVALLAMSAWLTIPASFLFAVTGGQSIPPLNRSKPWPNRRESAFGRMLPICARGDNQGVRPIRKLLARLTRAVADLPSPRPPAKLPQPVSMSDESVSNLDPNWIPSPLSPIALYARNPRVSGGFLKSGRLDLNQRPFGPRPSGSDARCFPERPGVPIIPWMHVLDSTGTKAVPHGSLRPT
jgi:hypothetical protein